MQEPKDAEFEVALQAITDRVKRIRESVSTETLLDGLVQVDKLDSTWDNWAQWDQWNQFHNVI